MSTYGRMLRGTEGEPCESRWQELEAQFQRLQMQQVMMMDPGSFQRLLDTLRGDLSFPPHSAVFAMLQS